MKPVSNARMVVIVVVALLSIWFTWPTAVYYIHLTKQPDPTTRPPLTASPRPGPDQLDLIPKWEADNPEAVAWRAANPAYVAWEERADELQKNAIPLGLDLRGGVDVTVALDRGKLLETKVASLRDGLRNNATLAAQKTAINVIEGADPAKVTLEVPDKADAQTVANMLNKEYGGTIDRNVSAADLQAGPVTFGVKADAVSTDLAEMMEGVRKALEDRINSLGVTQPKIAVQGSDRIRISVPGEKDPDRVINNLIQPFELEFRMVSLANATYQPGQPVPPGAELVHARMSHWDKDKQALVYAESDMLLMKKAELKGGDLRSAGVIYNPSDLDSQIQVSLEFTDEGARKFSDLTTKAANETQKRQMAILLSGVVRSAPGIDEPIRDGRAVIRGGFSQEEATELSQVLKAGALPAPLKIESKRTVGATLGSQSIKQGVQALFFGTLLISVFMIAYYGTAGVIAIIALILNVMMVVAIMALSRATLTLSGIGGILLTVGMAVDSNVLIYERIREELNNGRPLRQAIGLGGTRAFAVILDAHVTTLITSLVLLQFTEGSVFGFALTMTFGLLTNLFTGLTVTTTLCALWFARTGKLSLGNFAVLKDPKTDWIGMRWLSFGGSGALILVLMIAVALRGGLPMGVEFAGGVSAELTFAGDTTESQIRDALNGTPVAGGSVTRVTDRARGFIIDAPLVAAAAGQPGDSALSERALRQALESKFAGQYTIESVDTFGAQVGQEFATLAFVVVFLASICILVYLAFRFEWVFGAATVVAMIHDLIIVTLISALWGVDISLDAVAALMVLLGFSVNDTIVIFDRIRENSSTVFGKSFKDQCNDAMNQSLSRTIITSGTVLFASLMLLVFGGEGLAPFAKIITAGVICGTYSTNLIAVPFVYIWNEWRGDKVQRQLAEKHKPKPDANKPVRGPIQKRTA